MLFVFYDAGMIRWLAAVLPLLFLSLAHAQPSGSDLRVTLTVPPAVRLGEVMTATAIVENRGPVTAPNVRAAIRIIPGTQCDQPNLLLGDLAPGESKTISCSQEVIDYGLSYLKSTAAADSNPPEPSARRLDNIVTAFTDRVGDGVDLGVSMNQVWMTVRPGLPFPLSIFYWNASRTPATNALIRMTLTAGSFGKLPEGCTADGLEALCSVGTVRPSPDPESGEAHVLHFEIVAPDASEVQFIAVANVSSDQPDPRRSSDTVHAEMMTFRTFSVHEASEAALRSALSAAGDSCTGTPCLLAFRIPTAAGTKWHTIRLTSPLPPVRGRTLLIDGTTQAGYYGDTNPDGPEIEIDGSALTTGDGLALPAGCGIAVRGLVLNGFPQSAVSLRDPFDSTCRQFTVIEKNYIGTDPTGTRAVPNERGIVADSISAFSVVDNVISGNRRSAVYVVRGAGLVRRNIIGLNRTHDAPLPNGASGVYVSADGDGTDIDDNYIGFNAHFGIAIDSGAEHVAVNGNSMQANGGAAIDWGLDGAATRGPVPAPTVRSATFANGVTTIELDLPNFPSFPFLSVYASDAPDDSGYGEGQYFLGVVRGPFRLEVPADLRGKWISATMTAVEYFGIVRSNADTGYTTSTTSEMSLAVPVN